MKEKNPEILTAFVDGENVELRELAEALQLPGALDRLQQFVELRAGVGEMQDRPGNEFYIAMERVISPAHDRAPWWRRAVPIPAPVLAAAAVAALAILAWIGNSGPPTDDVAGRPPEPDRIVHFEPGVDWTFQDGKL